MNVARILSEWATVIMVILVSPTPLLVYVTRLRRCGVPVDGEDGFVASEDQFARSLYTSKEWPR